ncbi:MAG: RagB/SusD family nutrient uptake outer membrane protein, partial [Bacteroidia bacterium]|nr:RagB/SusD family nutrient uptake outer membrane protein [Bacteroidia bacterium]
IMGMGLAFTTSCSWFNGYLDKAPESGLTDDLVFTKYANFRQFFDACYNGRKYYNGGWVTTWNYQVCCPLYVDTWDQKYCINSTTDACDQGRYMEGQAWKSGNMSETIVGKLCYDGARRPILGACFDDIRICNIAIRRIDEVKDFVTDDDKNDFLGQAYFLRGLYHWALFRYWGPMPYLDYVMGPYDKTWDLARMEKNDYLHRIVGDYDSAYYYFNLAGKIRRDPVGSLDYDAYQMYRPNGMAAKAFKAKALLYAASPLNNKNGTADWQEAAVAAWDAIQVAESHGVIVLPLKDVSGNDRHYNYFGKTVCEESIWTRNMGSQTWNWGGGSGAIATMWGGHFMAHASASGINPTQNFVDKYETKWGDPLNTQAERDAATALGHYKEQQPFLNRDPRLYTDIIYNGSPCQGWGGGTQGPANTAPIFMNGTTPSDLLTTAYNGRSYTGYAMRKYWNNNSTKNQGTGTTWTEVLSRLSEVYLNYAEAANEAYGPNGSAPGATYTALQAINKIRAKSGMPDVLPAFIGSTAALRPRIWNERNIELAWEGQHYYDDIRRWMILPQVMGGKLYAIIPQKTTVSATYPDGFVYTRTELPGDRQIAWEEGMYYLPFLNADALKMKNFVSNPVW